MKRKIYMNQGINVQMYATEGISNPNNCSSVCGYGSGEGSSDGTGSSLPPIAFELFAGTLVGAFITSDTTNDPDD